MLREACMRLSSSSELSEELLHYTLVAFLDRPDTQRIIDSGGGFYFCLRIATNAWKSTTSPFYRTYRDPRLRIPLNEKHPDAKLEYDRDDTDRITNPTGHVDKIKRALMQNDSSEEMEVLYEKIDKALSELSWYERELTRAYAEHGGNAARLSRVTKIPRTSINLTISRVRQYIKKRIQ